MKTFSASRGTAGWRRAVLLCFGLIACRLCGAPWPTLDQLPAQTNLPDPLVRMDGRRVQTSREWMQERRPELKSLFAHFMYGQAPPPPATLRFRVERTLTNYLDGRATRKDVFIDLAPQGAPSVYLLLLVPNGRTQPAPVFVGVNFCGNHTVLADPTIPLATNWMPNFCEGCTNHQATAAARGADAKSWSIEPLLERGYALATFYAGSVEPDAPDALEGVRGWYARVAAAAGDPSATGYDWGAVAAWAWGFQRAVDYLVTDRDIDRQRIGIVGHSRNGKAALLAAAFDERIALVAPIQAGCGGTAPSRGKLGETVAQINDRFPHWFNGAFKQFNAQVDRLPFDQHALIALVAPRPVLLLNATEDTWANPPGQFEMLRAADPVYRLLGSPGLQAREMPPIGQLVDSPLGYFIRPGKHQVTRQDWQAILDFADRQWGQRR